MEYAASEIQRQFERGPYPGEDFFRLKVTGKGESRWVNVAPEQLADIVALLDTTAEVPPVTPTISAQAVTAAT